MLVPKTEESPSIPVFPNSPSSGAFPSGGPWRIIVQVTDWTWALLQWFSIWAASDSSSGIIKTESWSPSAEFLIKKVWGAT